MKSLRFWFRRTRSDFILILNYLKGYEKLRLPTDLTNPDLDNIETIWAKRLGNQLYRIENVPFLNDQVNLGDVVKCETSSDNFSLVVEIIRKSGSRNLQVEFAKETSAENAVDVIEELKRKKVFYERAGARFYVFNVEPDMNYEEIHGLLKTKEDEGVLRIYE